MEKEVIEIKNAPPPVGPYSQAVRAGGFIFISGQLPLDPSSGEKIQGEIEEETRRVLENLKKILEGAGSSLEKVIKTTIYITDISEFAKVNNVYGEYFSSRPPARSTVQAAALPRGAKVEIEAVAVE